MAKKSLLIRPAAPTAPGGFAPEAPVAYRPEFIRFPRSGQRCPWTGLCRSTMIKIIKTDKVHAISLRKDGATKGVTLITLSSLLGYLHAQGGSTK